MSTATLTVPDTGSFPAPTGAPAAEWITLAEAARLLGRSGNPNGVKSIALAGAIRTRAMPGARTLYRREDVEALAAYNAR
jgi:hypothetical protein